MFFLRESPLNVISCVALSRYQINHEGSTVNKKNYFSAIKTQAGEKIYNLIAATLAE